MPTYDYVCDACDHKFELFQSITEAVKKKCPECKKPKLRRLFGTGAAVMFKGSGFYTTDYRSEDYKKRASEEKPASTNGSCRLEVRRRLKEREQVCGETKFRIRLEAEIEIGKRRNRK